MLLSFGQMMFEASAVALAEADDDVAEPADAGVAVTVTVDAAVGLAS